MFPFFQHSWLSCRLLDNLRVWIIERAYFCKDDDGLSTVNSRSTTTEFLFFLKKKLRYCKVSWAGWTCDVSENVRAMTLKASHYCCVVSKNEVKKWPSRRIHQSLRQLLLCSETVIMIVIRAFLAHQLPLYRSISRSLLIRQQQHY